MKTLYRVGLSTILGSLLGFAFFTWLSHSNILPPDFYVFLDKNPGAAKIIMFFIILVVSSIFYRITGFFIENDQTHKSSNNQKESTNNELQELANPSVLKSLYDKSGFIVSKNHRMKSAITKEHIVYLGPTGAGKTTSGYMPNLLDPIAIPGSVIINDTKRELIRDTANARIEFGSKVFLFSPFDPQLSVRINPLKQMRSTTELRGLARSILINGRGGATGSNQDWLSMAEPLLASIIIAAIQVEKNPTIPKCIRKIIENDDEQLYKYVMRSGDMEAVDSWNLYKQSSGAKSTSSGIRTTLGSSLQLFLDKNIEHVISGNDFDIRDLMIDKISFYIHVPESKAEYAKPLTAMLYYLLFDILSNEEGQIVPFLLDEFANIGYIPNFSSYVTLFRGRGLPLILGIQSTTQMESLYGSDAGTIMDNLKTKVLFPGMGPDSADYAAKILEGVSLDGKPLTPSRIRQLPDDKVIVISRNKPPVLDIANYYANDKQMLAKVANNFNVTKLARTFEDLIDDSTPTPKVIVESGTTEKDDLNLLKRKSSTKNEENDLDDVVF